MSEEFVNIEIDGVPMKAAKGAMVIKVADDAGLLIPRFCYHEKLSVAANCRMCLVEVEKAPKPMPACATPVTEGMKVFTKSPKALSAQKNSMEFLLINHPLDCPICDQGGECELQDLALGYGRGVSQYTEGKRSVFDENIGPLISTDMTRCIHCTRCVRFGQEIAGIQELGATGRGEHMRIGTYVGQAVKHEMSGNVIDLCPVGALNSKPFRMKSRGWEMTQHEAIGPHDSVGSNIYTHTLRGRLMRVVPQSNEDINETWISDRDRFSYTGVHSLDRLERPMVRDGDGWHEVDWQVALERAAAALKKVSADDIGVLGAPTASLEELYLLQDIARKLGTCNIDHRLSQGDFRDDEAEPAFPWLGLPLADLEKLDAALVIGANIRSEAPIVAHRLRKAALADGEIMFINPRDYELHFKVAGNIVAAPAALPEALAGLVKALAGETGKAVPAPAQALVESVQVTDAHRDMAARLAGRDNALVLVGRLAMTHPAWADLRALAAAAADLAGVRFGYLPPAANSVGAALAGVLPRRGPGGIRLEQAGLNARDMFTTPRKAYLLMGVEPELESWNGAEALAALTAAGDVVALTSFVTPTMQEYASVLLPMGAFGESAATFVNCEGRRQSFNGFAQPFADARPGWKILRVLGNVLGLGGFDYDAIEDVRTALTQQIGEVTPDNRFAGTRKLAKPKAAAGLQRASEIGIYASDALVRRSEPLQQTDAARRTVHVAPVDAERLGIADGAPVEVSQQDTHVQLDAEVDSRITEGTVWLPAGVPETAALGPFYGNVELRPVATQAAEEV
ncbi:MAG TPA: NADH-quinone oxidoreductase subunit NuoG [Gammaproteobacteria bacterium]|nr:NADH-quinone oxidoreductase subunit NuoG [Gammaproteobacteria bacterium]